MATSFVLSVFGLTKNIDLAILFNTNTDSDNSYIIYTMGLLPVALTSFGYHHSVATMRAYYKNEHKAKLAILGGTTIALALYLLWVISILVIYHEINFHQLLPVMAI